MLKVNKMASIAIMIGGALINATAFVGECYLAKYLSGDQNSVEEEKKRHDLAAKQPMISIKKKIKQSLLIGLQLMTESRKRQNRIWWTQILL